MPYCGRCLNVGRAGMRGAPPEYRQFNLASAVLLRQAPPTPNRASMRFAGSRRLWTSSRVNTWTRAVGRSFAGAILLSRLAKRTQRSTGSRRSAPWNGSTHVTTRMPTGGGGQERDEAAKYRPDAKASVLLWPRTTTVLERIAAAHEADAERQDQSAEQRDW